MSRCFIYLDESGDLGFKFDAPYRAGGSSRHLTLAAAICAEESRKHVKRFIVDFYKARAVPAGRELKWTDLGPPDRVDLGRRAAQLNARKREIRLASITVFKPNVMMHIQADPNKLYNYMTGLLLLPIMKQFDEVHFVPDARSIKVNSGNSLHDYLQTKLWFDCNVATKLTTQPTDSIQCKQLHFTDFVCGAVQSHHEDGSSDARNALLPAIDCKRLFF